MNTSNKDLLKFTVSDISTFKIALDSLSYKRNNSSYQKVNVKATSRGLIITSSDPCNVVFSKWLIRSSFFEQNDGQYELKIKNKEVLHSHFNEDLSITFSIEPDEILSAIDKCYVPIEFTYPVNDSKLELVIRDKIGRTDEDLKYNLTEYIELDTYDCTENSLISGSELEDVLASVKAKLKIFKLAFRHFSSLEDSQTIAIKTKNEPQALKISVDEPQSQILSQAVIIPWAKDVKIEMVGEVSAHFKIGSLRNALENLSKDSLECTFEILGGNSDYPSKLLRIGVTELAKNIFIEKWVRPSEYDEEENEEF